MILSILSCPYTHVKGFQLQRPENLTILASMKYPFENKFPNMEKATFTASSAEVAGEVHAGSDTSFWFHVSIRADIAPVYIGDGSNIQDGSVIHVSRDIPCRVGKSVTVGHGVILHACTIGDSCLIGMGAIVLDNAEIGEQSIVGAGALVTQNKKFPPRSLIIGSPAQAVRTLTEKEVAGIRNNAEEYIALARAYRSNSENS